MSDIPKEIIDNFNSQINERLASPLTGSFTIAWLIWNYKFIVILFSANSVTKTFDLIQKICFPDLHAVALNGFLYPLASALFYIFVLPYPSSWAYNFTRLRQKVLAEIRQKIDDETPLPLSEARALRNELRLKDTAFDQAMIRSKAEVDQLRNELEKISLQLAISESNIKKFSPTFPHLIILNAISERDFKITKEQLIKQVSMPAIEVEFMLTQLQEQNCVQSRHDQRGNLVFGLAQEGRKYLIDLPEATKEKLAGS